jgi:hypothetical protein
MTRRSRRPSSPFAATLAAVFVLGCNGAADTHDDGTSDGDVRDATPIDASADADPWTDTVSVLGVGTAVGTGVLGPVYPMGVWASDDQVVVVGMAKADFSWGGTTYPRGGFVLAFDASTGAVRWHRAVGDSVGAITAVGSDLAIVGSFSRSITLATTGATTTLTSAGLTDGVVAVLTQAGEVRWARRYGSATFDQGFAIASDGDAVVVAGAITGLADLGSGCGTLQAQVGGDDGDGHPMGVYDAVVLRYPAGGACPWGAAIGAPVEDDMAFGVTVKDGAVLVTGQAARPLLVRSTSAPADVDVGGAPTKRPSPFLLRLDPAGARAPAAWFVVEPTGGGRGRSIAQRAGGADVLWAFTCGAGSKLTHDALAPLDVGEGAHVLTLRDDAMVHAVDLGPRTLDIGPLATTDTLAVVAATEADPIGVLLAKMSATSTSIARHAGAGATGLPFAMATHGATIWIAGYTGAPLSLGEPPTKIEPGPEGGFFVARVAP